MTRALLVLILVAGTAGVARALDGESEKRPIARVEFLPKAEPSASSEAERIGRALEQSGAGSSPRPELQ